MEIALIGDKHTVHGFRLAGVRKTFVMEEPSGKNIREALKGLFEGGVGIILVSEKVAAEIGGALDEATKLRRGIVPIILEIPDSSGPLAGKIDPMRELIRRTVGFEIA